MQPTGLKFSVVYNQGTVLIEEFKSKVTRLYKATFPDNNVLVFTKGNYPVGGTFWTSIPEGKQELAEAIGALIDRHFKQGSSRSDNTPSQTSLF